LLQRGLDAFQASGAELTLSFQFSILGEAYTQAGRFEDARQALDKGLAIAEKNDERCHEAELLRLRGELLLAESQQQAAAEDCFRQAIETARHQRSKAWELRATMSLARLWQRQGRRGDACGALSAVYGAYTEGFTTPDLVDAAALLESLAWYQSPSIAAKNEFGFDGLRNDLVTIERFQKMFESRFTPKSVSTSIVTSANSPG
jgi:predicted ATPase